MATKQEMLAEIRDLGVDTDVTVEDSWQDISDALARVKASLEPDPDEPLFTVAQLQPYSRSLFGVPPQVLVGARSAGFLKEPTTKADAARAIRRFHEGS